MKLAVVGSRDYPQLWRIVDLIINLPKEIVVISGHARGVDKVAEFVAIARGMKTEIYPVSELEWNQLGKKAGPLRNSKIVIACDALIAFYDGVSSGTKDVIKKAQEANKLLMVVGPDGKKVTLY